MTGGLAEASGAASQGPVPRLHVVTDDAVLARPGFGAAAAAVLAAGGGAVAVHVRGPGTPGGRLLELAAPLAALARGSGAWLVVNDRVDVALAARSHAVHLGARSLPVPVALALLGPGGRVGVSVHAAHEGAAAAAEGAGWIFAGTIFSTPSHPGRVGAGPELVARVAAGTPGVPVLAIGGVTAQRVPAVLGAGGWGVAVIRGVWDAPDPGEATRAYLQALADAARGGGAGGHGETT